MHLAYPPSAQDRINASINAPNRAKLEATRARSGGGEARFTAPKWIVEGRTGASTTDRVRGRRGSRVGIKVGCGPVIELAAIHGGKVQVSESLVLMAHLLHHLEPGG